MTLAVRGANSQIAVELRKLLPLDEQVIAVGRGEPMPWAERYLFCCGLMLGKQDYSVSELRASYEANYHSVRRECDRIIAGNLQARICVIGSESGFSGSFDAAYAVSKAALHRYVEAKRLLTRVQQLVCIAPSIIADAGMTMRRKDGDVLIRKCRAHPKGRFITSLEVARAVHFALYVDEGYLSNVVVRMNGGQHTAVPAVSAHA